MTIDESHKDRNASRKRRGWSKRNCKAVITREWFQNVVCHTLITVADIAGFIPAACHTVLRYQISDEGSAGTFDADYFLCWVKTCLCPVLSNFQCGEPRSITRKKEFACSCKKPKWSLHDSSLKQMLINSNIFQVYSTCLFVLIFPILRINGDGVCSFIWEKINASPVTASVCDSNSAILSNFMHFFDRPKLNLIIKELFFTLDEDSICSCRIAWKIEVLSISVHDVAFHCFL